MSFQSPLFDFCRSLGSPPPTVVQLLLLPHNPHNSSVIIWCSIFNDINKYKHTQGSILPHPTLCVVIALLVLLIRRRQQQPKLRGGVPANKRNCCSTFIRQLYKHRLMMKKRPRNLSVPWDTSRGCWFWLRIQSAARPTWLVVDDTER